MNKNDQNLPGTTGAHPQWFAENFQLFERALNGEKSSPTHVLRRKGFERFSATGLPTPKTEEWKYTDVQSLSKTSFERMDAPRGDAPTVEISAGLSPHVTLCNGFCIGKITPVKGLTIVSLRDALHGKAGAEVQKLLETKMGANADVEELPLAALNSAFLDDGVVVFAPKSSTVKEPVVISHIVDRDAAGKVCHPRYFFVAEEGAHVTIVDFFGTAEGVKGSYLANPVVECIVADGAQLDHYRLQAESESAYHLGVLSASLGDRAQFRTHFFSFGGRLARNEISMRFDGEHGEGTLNGLTVLNADQHVDNHTLLDHAKPNCLSHELFKGIYADKSHGVFNGTIIVRPDAQKTNAIQSNQSLLLSDEAQIDAKPQLKIWADDVKCTHGATVGQLDQDALFYIRSRGVSEKDAKNMLIHAFAAELTTEIKCEPVREWVDARLASKLDERMLKAAK